jgi:hypothetical protein
MYGVNLSTGVERGSDIYSRFLGTILILRL